MIDKKNNESVYLKKSNKKFLIISNTSKYLYHYRSLLLSQLKTNFKELFIIAPEDNYSNFLINYGYFINLNLSSNSNNNPFNLIKSLYSLFVSIKNIKPDIVHSHTLKPNLLVSIINLIFGINTVISFPGLGKLSTSKGLKLFLLKIILRTIYFSSIYKFDKKYLLIKNFSRVKFIFQNPNDIKFFAELVNTKPHNKLFNLIPGSGVPDRYFSSVKEYSRNYKNNFDFIYCARLIKSKGIELFIKLSSHFRKSKFFVYGELDVNSEDYLSNDEISFYKNKNQNLLFMDHKKDPLLNHHNDQSIFIIPSMYGEGLPRAILEAMSLEIPVVASEKSCVGLFDKKNLFVVEDNNLNSYINVIREIKYKKNTDDFNKFLRMAKENVKKKYKESKIVGDTIDLYRNF